MPICGQHQKNQYLMYYMAINNQNSGLFEFSLQTGQDSGQLLVIQDYLKFFGTSGHFSHNRYLACKLMLAAHFSLLNVCLVTCSKGYGAGQNMLSCL